MLKSWRLYRGLTGIEKNPENFLLKREIGSNLLVIYLDYKLQLFLRQMVRTRFLLQLSI